MVLMSVHREWCISNVVHCVLGHVKILIYWNALVGVSQDASVPMDKLCKMEGVLTQSSAKVHTYIRTYKHICYVCMCSLLVALIKHIHFAICDPICKNPEQSRREHIAVQTKTLLSVVPCIFCFVFKVII